MSSALLTSFWRLGGADCQAEKVAARFGEGGTEVEVLFAQSPLISECYREPVARGRASLENELLLFLFSIFVSVFWMSSFCGGYCIFPALCLAANSHHLKYFCYGATSQAAAQVLVKVSHGRQQPCSHVSLKYLLTAGRDFPFVSHFSLFSCRLLFFFAAFLRVSVTTWGSG